MAWAPHAPSTHRPRAQNGDPCRFPAAMPNRSLLFVAGYYLKEFLPMMDRLPHFFLLTHWSDAPIDTKSKFFRPILDHPKLLLWFAYSAESPHPKLIPLPLGMSHNMAHRSGARAHGPPPPPPVSRDALEGKGPQRRPQRGGYGTRCDARCAIFWVVWLTLFP